MQRLQDLCEHNVELAQKHHGKESLYCVRYYYTRFSQSLHSGSGERIKKTIDTLGCMELDG